MPTKAKKAIASRPAKPVAKSRSARPAVSAKHAQLKNLYENNGFINYNTDPTKMAPPVNRPRYRNHPALVWVIVILVLALAAASGVAAYYYWQTGVIMMQAEEKIAEQQAAAEADAAAAAQTQTDQTATAATTTIDPLEAWLTLTDASSTFQMKYPSQWQLNAQGDYSWQLTLGADGSAATISYQTTTKNLTAFLADIDRVNATAWEGKPSVKVGNQGDVKVGTLPAYQRWQKMLAADMDQIITYIPVGKKVYMVSVYAPILSKETIDSYGLFLTTFKYTEPTSTAPVGTKIR